MTELPNNEIGASAFSESMVKNAAYTYIEQEIEVLETKIHALTAEKLAWKRRHNTLSIVSRLPSETLSVIFKFVAKGAWIKKYSVKLPRLHWIRVTHVCSHWRHVALNFPDLWTKILFDHPKAALKMFDRSKKAPLSVTLGQVSASISQKYRFLTRIMDEIYRIRKLSLYIDHKIGGSRLQEVHGLLSTRVAPILETITIKYPSSKIPLEYMLPETFFEDSPRLRVVDLQNCNLHWNFPFLHTLTSLKIDTVFSRHSVDILISAMANIPNLKTLSLISVFCTPPDTGDVPVPAGIAQLPCLSNIHLGDALANCVAFLTGLTYPRTAVVKIELYNLELRGYPVAVNAFHHLLSERFGPIRSLSVTECIFNAECTLRIWTEPGFESTPLEIMVWHQEGIERTLSMIWQGLRLQDLETLEVDEALISTSEWLNIFGGLQHLEYIDVSRHPDVNNFVYALSRGLTPTEASGMTHKGGRLKFKALRRLRMFGLTFRLIYARDESCIETLCRIFRQRRKRGMPLHELRLDICDGLDEDKITELEKVINSVDWTSC